MSFSSLIDAFQIAGIPPLPPPAFGPCRRWHSVFAGIESHASANGRHHDVSWVHNRSAVTAIYLGVRMRTQFLLAGLLLLTSVTGASLAAQAVPDILYYKLNEGTGTTTANDANPGQGSNPATVTGATWVTSGQRLGAGALNFAASGDQVSTGIDAASALSGDFTMEVWLRSSSPLIGKPLISDGSGFYLLATDTPYLVSGAASLFGTISVSDGNWHQVALVRDATAQTLTLYVDGVQDGTIGSAGFAPVSAPIVVGDSNLGISSPYDLDEVRIFGSARSGGQIQYEMSHELPILQGDPEIQVQDQNSNNVYSGNTISLGNVETGATKYLTFSVENLGATNPLDVSAISVAPSGVGNVNVTAAPALSTASPVPASGAATFMVDPSPAADGPFECTITISNNDADEGSYTVVIQGVGVDPKPAIGAPTVSSQGSVLLTEVCSNPASSTDQYLELTNVTPDPVNTSGWYVVWYDFDQSPTATWTTYLTSGVLAGGATWVIVDNINPSSATPPGDQYLGVSISGFQDDGFVLFDNLDTIVDAAFFGNAPPATITWPTTIGSEWSGSTTAPGISNFGFSVSRIGNADHNDASDWSGMPAQSINSVNSGLSTDFSQIPTATLGGTSPAYTGTLNQGDNLDITFQATDEIATQHLSFTVSVTGGTLTGAQAGFNESFPYSPAGGGFSPQSVSLTGIAAMAGTIELTIEASDGTNIGTATYTLTIVAAPQMEVSWLSPIADGGTVIADTGTSRSFTFTISNSGDASLNLTGTPLVSIVPVTNVYSASGVSAMPSTPVASNGSTTFTVYYSPNALFASPYEFLVVINSDDSSRSPYQFTVKGTAYVTTIAPEISIFGTNWVDAGGGLYTLTLDPGDTISDTITAVDPGANNMTVTVTNPTTVPTTLTAQPTDITTPTAGPLGLLWTGTADGANDPGSYDWGIVIDNGTLSTAITARIIINDVAPTHAIASALGGDGDVSTPYTAGFTQGDDGSVSVDLATVSDGNTGQTLSLGTVTKAAEPSFAVGGFTFTLVSGNTLNVAPSSALAAGDVGTWAYTVEVSDGTNTTTMHVSITVSASSGGGSGGSGGGDNSGCAITSHAQYIWFLFVLLPLILYLRRRRVR